MNQIQNGADSQTLLMNLFQQNPNAQQIIPLIKMNNGDIKGLAQFMANQRGIDLNALIRALQN